jgi:hypothetical protein
MKMKKEKYAGEKREEQLRRMREGIHGRVKLIHRKHKDIFSPTTNKTS